jgi:hypothetical protein
MKQKSVGFFLAFLAGLAGGVIGAHVTQPAQATTGIIVAREFRLMSAQGKEVGSLQAGAEGGELLLRDPNGTRKVQFYGGKKAPWLGFFGPGGKEANLGLGYGDGNNNPAVWFSRPGHGFMKVQIEDAGPKLRLFNSSNQEVWTAP